MNVTFDESIDESIQFRITCLEIITRCTTCITPTPALYRDRCGFSYLISYCLKLSISFLPLFLLLPIKIGLTNAVEPL